MDEIEKTALDKAIDAADGVSSLAFKLGIKAPSVSGWKVAGKVPAKRCIAIEEACGGAVTRYDLRPDIFGRGDQKESEAASTALTRIASNRQAAA